jgi:hypothetical protein
MLQNWKSILAILILTVFACGQALAIQRVAPKMGVWEFRGSYAMPQGTYDGIVGIPFDFGNGQYFEADAEDVYEDGFGFGVSYGQIVGGHWQFSIGFDYSQSDVLDSLGWVLADTLFSITFVGPTEAHQYDLTLRGVYELNNLAHTFWSPFFGLSAATGLTSVSTRGYESDNQINFALNMDFGLDVKIWQDANNRSFVTLSSMNSWNFLTTGERASYLQIGGGIKYFFKP